MGLDIKILHEVNKLFQSKKWDMNTKQGGLYDNFCKRLSIIPNAGDQRFIIELSKDFLCVDIKKVFENIEIVFFNIEEDIYNKYKKINIMPLSKRICINTKETKSGEAYFFFLKRSDFFSWFDFYPKKFQFNEKLNANIINDSNAIFLIDDYIGSGNTVIDIYNEVVNCFPQVNPHNVYVLAPYAQESGIQKIADEIKVKVYSEVVQKKGISDKYEKHLVPTYLSKMMSIEDNISNNIKTSGLSLGYMQSEALIRILNKTPNNTFPFFWYDTPITNSPFPRRLKL